MELCFTYGIHKHLTRIVIAPAGAKVTEATIRMWLLNKFISSLAVLSWKTGLKARIPRKASSHLLGQKSQEPQSEHGY